MSTRLETCEETLPYAIICNADFTGMEADLGVLYADYGRYNEALEWFRKVSFEDMNDSQMTAYKTTVIKTLGLRKAFEMGFTDTPPYDMKLDNAFSDGILKLVQVDDVGVNKDKLQLVISDECLQVMMKNEIEKFESEEDAKKYLREAFEESVVTCLSPDGRNALLKRVGHGEGLGSFFSVTGNYAFPVFPNSQRGAEDIYNESKYFLNSVAIESEGLVWSHNGQYIVFPHWHSLMELGSFFQSAPLILDVTTGELLF